MEVKQLLSVTEHSHDPDPDKAEAAKVKNTIKAVGVTNRIRPANIIADTIYQQPLQVRCAIGRMFDVYRNPYESWSKSVVFHSLLICSRISGFSHL